MDSELYLPGQSCMSAHGISIDLQNANIVSQISSDSQMITLCSRTISVVLESDWAQNSTYIVITKSHTHTTVTLVNIYTHLDITN